MSEVVMEIRSFLPYIRAKHKMFNRLQKAGTEL